MKICSQILIRVNIKRTFQTIRTIMKIKHKITQMIIGYNKIIEIALIIKTMICNIKMIHLILTKHHIKMKTCKI